MAIFGVLIGIFGLVLILVAFGLNLFHFLSQRSLSYNLLNILGSVFLAYYSLILGSIPFFILQLVWGLLSVYKLIHMAHFERRKK
jgi:hypothetical protein